LWAIVPFGWGVVFSGMMRASGMVFAPMVMAVAGIVLIELPLAVWLSRTSLGLAGIWIAYAASFTGMLIMQASWYQFVWKRKKIVALV
jgi:Na+-driven multidrug efflux pump